jgi:gliding motility-associated-like protein
VNARISIPDTIICENDPVQFFNHSSENTTFNWNLGNGTNTSENNPITEYEPGNYKVILSVNSNANCKDTAFKTMVVNITPPLSVNKDTFLCVGQGLGLMATTDADSIIWSPNKWINDPNSYTPQSTPDSTLYYKARAFYKSTGCFSKDSVFVTVQQKLNFKLTPHRDTSIIIGEYIDFVIEPQEPYEYLWTPSTGLSCNNCATARVMPTDSITYSLHVNDFNNCFSLDTSFKIFVKDTALYNAPSAFLPEGDEENRILYVRGKGIKQLLSFKIYNRWGNLVFESNDLSKGWDGKFQGKDQPIDTYIYTITIETLSGKILSRKGTVMLLR